jgi:hypothetical protein
METAKNATVIARYNTSFTIATSGFSMHNPLDKQRRKTCLKSALRFHKGLSMKAQAAEQQRLVVVSKEWMDCYSSPGLNR